MKAIDVWSGVTSDKWHASRVFPTHGSAFRVPKRAFLFLRESVYDLCSKAGYNFPSFRLAHGLLAVRSVYTMHCGGCFLPAQSMIQLVESHNDFNSLHIGLFYHVYIWTEPLIIYSNALSFLCKLGTSTNPHLPSSRLRIST